MAIDFANTANQRIDYGAVSAIQAKQLRTFVTWFTIDNLPGAVASLFGYANTAITDEHLEFYLDAANKLNILAGFSTSAGLWRYNTALTTGLHLLAVSYDYGSAANNPIIYWDGSSVAIVTGAPVGTYATGTSNSFRLGSTIAGDKSVDMKIHNFLIYNRILPAAEIAEIYANKKNILTSRSLIFAPSLCSQGNVGEGGTLAAGNTIPDQINGVLGVPAGSPVFRQDVYLSYP